MCQRRLATELGIAEEELQSLQEFWKYSFLFRQFEELEVCQRRLATELGRAEEELQSLQARIQDLNQGKWPSFYHKNNNIFYFILSISIAELALHSICANEKTCPIIETNMNFWS